MSCGIAEQDLLILLETSSLLDRLTSVEGILRKKMLEEDPEAAVDDEKKGTVSIVRPSLVNLSFS